MAASVRCLLTILPAIVMISSCDSASDPSDWQSPYRLIFSSTFYSGSTLPGIYAETVDGKRVLRLSPDTLKGYTFAPSPDGSKLLYSATTKYGGQHDIYVQARGSRIGTVIVADPASDIAPQWFGDGSGFAFLSNRTGNQALWLANVDGSQQRLGAPDSGHIYRFAVSPVGTRIAFTYDYSRLVIIDYLTGNMIFPLPDSFSVHAGSLSWSSDGQQLSLAIGDSLYTWSEDSGMQLQYVNDNLIAGTAWCPVGPYIAFNTGNKLRLLKTDEHATITLGSDMLWGGGLRWTQDGAFIGYESSDMVDPPSVTMVARDGRVHRRIRPTNQSASSPVWTLLAW